MSGTEVKAALASDTPLFANQSSVYSDMRYLIGKTGAESYIFTLLDGKTAAFSVVHLRPPGQLPFLPPGEQPPVAILRGLIAKQTWEPADGGVTAAYWFGDLAPKKQGSHCDLRPMHSRIVECRTRDKSLRDVVIRYHFFSGARKQMDIHYPLERVFSR